MSILVIASLTLGTALADGVHPGLEPATVDELVFPGDSIDIDKTVHTPEIPPRPDIVFLADNTGRMGGAIANVEANAAAVMAAVLAAQPDAQFAVAYYHDPGWAVTQGLTSNTGLVQTAINGWSASGGGDTPEAQMKALFGIATGSIIFRTDSTPIIAWFGDSTGHEGGSYPTRAATIAALVAAGIKVVAVPVSGGNGLNATGQAADITNATGGVLLPGGSPDQVADQILVGLQNIPVAVSMASDCGDPISTSFAPPSILGLTSGSDAGFVETISVSASAAGGTYTCTDWALIDGQPMVDSNGDLITEDKTIHVPGIDLQLDVDTNELLPDATHTVTATVSAGDYGPVEGVLVEFEILSGPNAGETGSSTTDSNGEAPYTYPAAQGTAGLGTDTIEGFFSGDSGVEVCDTTEKTWEDTTPPVPVCTETVNPHGNNVPKAPGQGGQGQNQDGFYELTATDLVWPQDALDIFVTDTGSGTVFGPFSVETLFKYTEDADATPEAKKIGSDNDKGQADAVDVHIIGNGDAAVTAVDGSGNVSDPVACLVPPLPK